MMMKKFIIGLTLMSSFLYLSCNKEEQLNNTSTNKTELTTLSTIQSVNGVYTFENWEELEDFLTANTDHTTLQSVLTSGASIVIGEDILKLVDNEYLVTSRVSNYTNYSSFTSASFDATTMNQLSILLDREETFSLKEFLSNNSAGVVENNNDLPAVMMGKRKFWGSEEVCGPVIRYPSLYEGGSDICSKECWTRTWVLWLKFDSKDFVTKSVSCD